jgi:hypothetical protein
MISTVYDPARETVRCAWRNERFVLGGFSASSRAGSAMARPTQASLFDRRLEAPERWKLASCIEGEICSYKVESWKVA